ncbi:MAG: hypothetical protein KDA32_15485 [Phycisphaerales bacterium]|nr:hypothetical protein [Phycisphaerales bacterium]
MLAQVHSFVLSGIDPLACEVEVDVAEAGLPKTTIVGKTHFPLASPRNGF